MVALLGTPSTNLLAWQNLTQGESAFCLHYLSEAVAGFILTSSYPSQGVVSLLSATYWFCLTSFIPSTLTLLDGASQPLSLNSALLSTPLS